MFYFYELYGVSLDINSFSAGMSVGEKTQQVFQLCTDMKHFPGHFERIPVRYPP